MKIKSITTMYGDLIKTRQTLLLLYTAIFAYIITVIEVILPFSWPDFIFLNISLFLAVSGTTVLNMYIDRDIDAVMERTKNRALPSGRITPKFVLINGIVITFMGVLIAFIFLDWLTALVIFLGFFVDVVVYTILLKRRTKFSIIFGGIAGGLPALAGRVAVLKSIDIIGFLFLLFILFWIPVHILTIALIPRNLEGYKQAKVPMWPVVSSEKETMRVIAIGAFLSSFTLYHIALLQEAIPIIRWLIGAFSVALFILVIRNLIKPSNKLTFTIFKIASIFMVLGFLLILLGVLIP
jgi:protoheme IX farnesyltransferase